MIRRRSGLGRVFCLARGHEGSWTLRPPVVAAGVAIPYVYWQRTCTRCGANEAVWHRVRAAAIDERLAVRDWLARSGQAVPDEPTPTSPRGMPVALA